jgi:AraC family transcriptional regulator
MSCQAEKDRNPVQRICVWRDRQCVPLSPSPTLSSAHSPWQGALLEHLVHGPHTEDTHQHLSHFLVLHLNGPSPLAWRWNGKTGVKTVGPGAISLVSRGTEDSTSFPEGSRRIVMSLEPCIFQRAFAEVEAGTDVELIEQWGFEDPKIEYILRALEADIQGGVPAGGLFGESLLNALAVHLLCRYSVKAIQSIQRNGLPKARLNRVIEYIEAHLNGEITLSALADIAGMSPHYFSELFRQSLGISPHQFVLRRRIDRGRRLLHNPSVSVLEAAIRSGFSDQSHFTKLFRRIVGVTPTKYRAIL